MSTWFLAIDFGTSNTCAAIVTEHGSRPVTFGPAQQTRMPSGVLLRPNGALVIGFEAERQAPLNPGWYDPAPKRSVGQATLLLGDRELPVVDVVAAVLSGVAAEARRQTGGTPPIQVSLTYPARWGAARQSVLRDAATRAGLGDVVLVSEPEAAAAYFAKHGDVHLGRPIAVYDLGGGTLDVAILTATTSGFRLVGRPGGIDPLGGDDVDERLLRLTLTRASEQVAGAEKLINPPDVEWQGHAAALRLEVRRAKEDLGSVDPAQLVLPGLGVSTELSRADLRAACASDVDASVDEFLRTVELAGIRLPELAGIYLAGGSSRLPMLSEALTKKLPASCHRLVRSLNDPKTAVALGAAELLFRDESSSEEHSPIMRARSRLPMRGFNRVLVAAAVIALVVGGLVWLRQRDTNDVSGTLRDSRGEPLANASLVIQTDQDKRQIKTTTDGDGHYSGSLPRGDYLVHAYVNVRYEGAVIAVYLARHSGSGVIKLPASGGIDLDWDLRVSGERDSPPEFGTSAFYGYTVDVYDGYDYEGVVAGLSALREDLNVVFRFEPVGPLVDGSESKPVEVTRTVGELLSGEEILGHDSQLQDIPLGSHVLTATLDVGDGTTIPLVFLSDDGASWSESQTISLAEVCEITCESTLFALEVGIDSTYLA